jgi:hypothetical protein
MSWTALDSHASAFGERNPLLHLSLGLLSAARRLDAVLEQFVVPGDDHAADDRDPLLVDFLLGAIAFRGRVAEALRRASESTAAPEPTTAPDEALLDRRPRTLLR